MHPFPKDYPEIKESELIKDVERIKKRKDAANRVLRPFAWFCASSMQPADPEWAHWIDTAGLFAQGYLFRALKDTPEYQNSRKVAGGYIERWKQGDINAAVGLAAAATLNSDAASAAIDAAYWMRVHNILKRFREGYSTDLVLNFDYWLTYERNKFLGRFEWDYLDNGRRSAINKQKNGKQSNG